MLKSIDSLRGRTIHAAHGDCGSVADLLIDDENWAIRHLVVDYRQVDTGQEGTGFARLN